MSDPHLLTVSVLPTLVLESSLASIYRLEPDITNQFHLRCVVSYPVCVISTTAARRHRRQGRSPYYMPNPEPEWGPGTAPKQRNQKPR